MRRMTSRERVAAAAAHKPVDRPPAFFWIEPHTLVKIAGEIRPPSSRLLGLAFDALAWARDNIPNEDISSGAPLAAFLIEHDYMLELGSDIVAFHWGFKPLWFKKITMNQGKLVFTDIYSIERGIGGLYAETVGPPLQTKEAVDSYRFPDFSHPIHYEHIRRFRMKHPGACIGIWCPGVQDWSQSWLGMENMYKMMIDHPKSVESFYTRLADHSMQIIRGGLRAGADVVMIGDDYGTQQSMMMSKAMWTRFTFPQLKRQCAEIHRRGGIAFLHSCGYVAPLLDKFVEAGVDILHPFQAVAGNGLAAAVAEYGGRLCFCTGIDVQKFPAMTPAQVRDSIFTAARTAARGRDGGFILAHTNYLQEDAPAENYEAMFSAIASLKSGRKI